MRHCVTPPPPLPPSLPPSAVVARVPQLYSQAKLMYDFLSEREASGPIGFNLMMLQSSLGYIMTKSVSE
eukprot:654457-Prymnesium_polylepis.1